MTKLYSFIVILSLSFLMGCGNKAVKQIEAVPGEYLVKTTSVVDVADSGCKVVDKVSKGYFKVRCEENSKGTNFIKGVESIEPNYIWYAIGMEDTYFDKLWGLNNSNGIDIDAPEAWAITKGSKEIKVMIIDTGIDYNHPDLKDNVWTNEVELNGLEGIDDDNNGCIDDIHGCDFANNDGDPMDDNNHGTHCSGTIGAVHNNIGVAGVMGEVTLVGCKFLKGNGGGTTDAAVKCIDYGIAVGVDVMSNSWGGGPASNALREAIERARDAGIIFTAASGNERNNNDSSPMYPSNYDIENVISVAAHDRNGNLSSFSNYGKKTVDVAAPGSDIMSTVRNGGYKSYSGTSMATPHVSGMLGLLLANEGFSSFEEIKDKLMHTGIYNTAWKKKLVSAARVNLFNLLRDFRPERPAVPTGWTKRSLEQALESEHPYANDLNKAWKIKILGASHIRVIVKKYELEKKYDFLVIKNGANVIAEKIDGNGENYISEYVEGDTLRLSLTTDRSQTKWGFLIQEIEYIMK